MATLVLGAVGAVVGFYAGGPGGGLKGAELGFAIGSTVGGIIDQMNQPPQGRLNDLSVMSSAFGTPLAMGWGKFKLPTNLIWSTNLQEGTTGGGSGVSPSQYVYSVSMALYICKGNSHITSSSLVRIDADDLVIYTTQSQANSGWFTTGGGSPWYGQSNMSVRFYTGSQTQTPDPLIVAQYGASAPAFRGGCYVVIENLVLTDFGNRVPNIVVRMDTGDIYLSDIISDVAATCGLTNADIDVSRVTGLKVTGHTARNAGTAKDILKPVLSAYNTDFVDIDGILTAVPRGGASVANITYADMGCSVVKSGSPIPAPRINKRIVQPIELPKTIDISYVSLDADYNEGHQTYARQSAKSWAKDRLSYNETTLTDNEAAIIMQRSLWLRWLESKPYTTTLLPKFMWLAPTDVITVQTDAAGTMTRTRIIDLEQDLFGKLSVTLVQDKLEYANIPTAINTPIGITKFSKSSISGTTFFAWSGTELRDLDGNSTGFYIVATGGQNWSGCTVYYSVDGGSNWTNAGSINKPSSFGLVRAALGHVYTPDINGFDVTNTVTLDAYPTADFNSTSEALVLAGEGNFALLCSSNSSISNVGNYEILGYSGATLNVDGSYTISTLLRSMRSTLDTGHTNSDMFINLDPAAVLRVNFRNRNRSGDTILVQCLSPGQAIGDVDPQTVYISGNNPPYSVVPATPSAPSLVNDGSNPTTAVDITVPASYGNNTHSYDIQWSANGITGWDTIPGGSNVALSSTTVHSGLTTATTYHYRLVGWTGTGSTGSSSIGALASITTM